MALRIAFDLDGVLADMESELLRQAGIVLGEAEIQKLQQRVEPAPDPSADPSNDDVPPLFRLDLTPRQQRKLWRHVESIENFWETLEELEPGVVSRLAQTAAERRWEIIFLTKRPECAGGTAQVQTQRWLRAKGFPLPSVYVVQGSRGRIAAALALDVVIDDRPENCLDVIVDSPARAILVWRDDEKRLPPTARRLGLGIVHSVGRCLDILTQIDESDRAGGGMMTKLKRLLGLKERAAV